MKKLLFIPFILLVAFGGWYAYKAVSSYEDSDYEAQGFFICNPEKTICERSEHVHAELTYHSCGQLINFPKEKGNTNLQHTHKELNKLHWHARERVDPVTREPLDPKPRQLKSFFEQMQMELPSQCSGKEAQTKVVVNGAEVVEKLDYIWKDGDKIEVTVE